MRVRPTRDTHVVVTCETCKRIRRFPNQPGYQLHQSASVVHTITSPALFAAAEAATAAAASAADGQPGGRRRHAPSTSVPKEKEDNEVGGEGVEPTRAEKRKRYKSPDEDGEKGGDGCFVPEEKNDNGPGKQDLDPNEGDKEKDD